MFNKVRVIIAVAVLGIAASASAAPTVVDFEADTAGTKVNGFSAAGVSGVTFTDTSGANLDVNNFGIQGIGQSLAVFSDDTSALQINFASAKNSLSLEFGNDDFSFTGQAITAYLQLFLTNVLVGDVSLAANNDDIMNQVIGYSGAAFDSAVFAYTDAAHNRLNLIEIVDNITFDNGNNVPEPESLALFGLALAGLAVARRRKI